MPTSPSPRRGAEPRPPARAGYAPSGLSSCADLRAGGARRRRQRAARLPRRASAARRPCVRRIFRAPCGTVRRAESRSMARDAGALEWHLHPASLLHAAHRGGPALGQGRVRAGRQTPASRARCRHGRRCSRRRARSRICSDFGLASGWRGTARVAGQEADTRSSRPPVRISKLGGGRHQRIGPGITAGGDGRESRAAMRCSSTTPPSLPVPMSAAVLTDTGGPLELDATIHSSAAKRETGLCRARSRRAPMRPRRCGLNWTTSRNCAPRDAQGRIPVDLEFTF